MKTNLDEQIPKQRHIYILRAIAIILVIICHVSQSQNQLSISVRQLLDFGRIGVQLFFFLSAYTLCLSMKARDDINSVSNFYIRRYFRIAPLYYTGIVVYLFYSRYLFYNHLIDIEKYQSYTPFNIICNVFFLHGLIPSANNSIVPGGWSIGTEMLFYLLFPLIFNVYDKISNKKITLFLPILALVSANLFILFSHYLLKLDITTPFYYYHILTQLSVFLIGMTYFFLEEEILKKFKNRVFSNTVFMVVLFASLFIVKHPKMIMSRSIGIFIIALGFCMLFTLVKKSDFNKPILQKIGQISFSIYIVHFLFSGLLTKVLVNTLKNYLNSYSLFLTTLSMTLIFSVLIALLTEKYIEKPGIDMGKRIIVFFQKGKN